MNQTAVDNKLHELARRIREMREIIGYTSAQMAERTDVPVDVYLRYEEGACD